MESYKKFEKKARHPTDSIFPILFVDPIVTRIAYLVKKRKSKVNPNSITAFRLFFISPAIITCLLLAPILHLRQFYLAAAILSYFIFFTDSLDGQIARGLDRKSKRGAFLDSVADRFATILFITMVLSVGLFLQNPFLIYGGIILFILKAFHMMVITKIYYYKEMWKEKENKSKVFKSGKASKILGLDLANHLGIQLAKLFGIKRCSTLLGGYEREVITFMLPALFVYFRLDLPAFWILIAFVVINMVFFLIRIKNVMRFKK